MRKAITRGALAGLAVLFLASKASAAPIAVGWVQWLQLDPTMGFFSIVSQSGGNYLGDPAFPVVDQLTVNNFALTVNPDGLANLNPLGDGFTYDSDSYFDPTFPVGATLTGNVNQLQATVDLDGNGVGLPSLWNILGGGAITDIGGGVVTLGGASLQDGERQILYVDMERAEVIPEPATMFLLGSGVVGLVARRRRARKA